MQPTTSDNPSSEPPQLLADIRRIAHPVATGGLESPPCAGQRRPVPAAGSQRRGVRHRSWAGVGLAVLLGLLLTACSSGSASRATSAASSNAPSPAAADSVSATSSGSSIPDPSAITITSAATLNPELLKDPVKFARYFTELYTFWGEISSDPATVPDTKSNEARAALLWQFFGPIGKQTYNNDENQFMLEYVSKGPYLQTGHPYDFTNEDQVAAATSSHEPVEALMHVPGRDSANYYLQDLEISYNGATGNWQLDRYTSALTQIPVPPTDAPTG